MRVLSIFAMLAALGVGATQTGAQETAELQVESFAEALVASPYLLSRTVTHVMPDGRKIAVTRTYRVRISPLEQGWLIEGHTVRVDVDAPARLAALAELERKRDDSGTFPMRLTPDGLLAPSDAVRPTDSATAAAAGEAVVARIRESDGDSERNRAAVATTRTLVAAGQNARIAWPVDLFRPTAAQRVETREIEGGTVIVALNARIDPESGLMRHFERRVTTRIGASERMVTEHWELQPEAGTNNPSN